MRQLKEGEGKPLYLCGGGALAGHFLRNQLIDELKIKLNPVLFGEGIPILSGISGVHPLTLLDVKTYDSGVVLLSYQVKQGE